MSRGTFISVDSADTEIKHLYADIVENLADYEAYFIELGLRLESGDGYFYFSRPNESRITIEQKLQSFAQWVDILDRRQALSTLTGCLWLLDKRLFMPGIASILP